ncbi:MAG: MotA/TolQ/ExbB proton channel family protein [Planctomycetota bacterium]|jgi:biopolymer transport protein ExbB/TolQ
MTNLKNTIQAIFRSPILWGCLASAGFYGLIRGGVLSHWLIERYCAGHPVEYVTMTMFFIGLAVLALKFTDVLAQYPRLSQPLFGPPSGTRLPVEECNTLLNRLAGLPSGRQSDYLVRRLREALDHVRRRGTAQSLDEELKYLADLEASRQYSSYALVRVIIWAIPMLGFLGTVIGLTMAIGNLAGGADLTDGAVKNSIPPAVAGLAEGAKVTERAVVDSIPQVVAALSVAFATTIQALVLSIVLMFVQYYTDRRESALLEEVGHRAAAELEGRLEQLPAGPDGQLAAVRRMAETVVQASERLVQRQAELWRESMEAAAARWTQMGKSAGEQLRAALSGALAEGLKTHGQQLAAIEQSAAEQNRRYWDRVQHAQVENSQAMASLQAAMAAQADVLGRAVEATGEVTRLEDALNRNLSTLAGAKHFEQTVMSLAAAIHLLNARLAEGPADAPPIQLETSRGETKAA